MNSSVHDRTFTRDATAVVGHLTHAGYSVTGPKSPGDRRPLAWRSCGSASSSALGAVGQWLDEPELARCRRLRVSQRLNFSFSHTAASGVERAA
jgi:hypothetical protein